MRPKKTNRPQLPALLSLGLVILLTAFAISPAYAAVEIPDGNYYDDINDLTVKIPGGNLTIRRTWFKDQWHHNRAWNDLQFEFSALDGSVKQIGRNGDLYVSATDSSTGSIFQFNENIFIDQTDSGFRWRDNEGNWIDYDSNGRILNYGDRNQTEVGFIYDGDGRRTGVTDGAGNQVFWYEHDALGQVIAVRDDADANQARRVVYQYIDGKISSVTDVLGHTTSYEYTNNNLTKVINPKGHATTMAYDANNRVASVTKAGGSAIYYAYLYDKNKIEYYVKVTRSSGRVDETWYDKDGAIIRQDVNGVMERSVVFDTTARTKTETNAAGYKTIYKMDEWDRVTQVTHPDNSTQTITYRASEKLVTSQINERGIETRYEYDTPGNLIKVTEAFGKPEQRITDMTYDANGRLLTITRQGDAKTTAATTALTYDAMGNLLSITDAENRLVFSAPVYNKAGQLLSWKDGRLLTWQQTYDLAGNLLTLTNPMVPPQMVTLEYDSIGNLINQIAPDATFSELAYDAEGKPTSMKDPLLATTTIEYNAAGLMQRILDAENKAVQTLNYDLRERPVSIIDGAGNAITTEYGGDGKLPDALAAMVTPLSRTEYQYDARGRPTTVTTNPGSTARVISTQYDAVGNVTESTDANGKVTRHTYDALNRLIQSQDMTIGDTVQYRYDNRDNLLTVTNEKGVVIRSYTYNKNSRKITETWAGGEVVTYAYDTNGNLIQKLDAKTPSQVTRYGYDNANRLSLIRYYPDLIATAPLKTVNYSYDNKGHFIGYNDGVTSSLITYDDADRKLTETTHFGPFSKTISYSYYKNGLRKTFTSASPDTTGSAGTTVTLNYDAANRWQSTSLPGEGAIAVNSYNWMLPTKITLPGGATQSQQYDAFGQVTQITSRDPASNILMDLGYTHDKVGNILSKSTVDGTTQYTYDDRYRLTGVDAPGTVNDENYSYDPAGNRITDQNTSANWQYNGNNQLQSHGDTALTYDANGNTVKESDTSTVPATLLRDYFYDTQNRLIDIRDGSGTLVANYDYDPLGRRIRKTINGVTIYYLYSDDGLIAEYNASGNEIQSYGYVPGSPWGTNPLYTKTVSGYAFYHTDHLGTPHMLTARNGAKVWEGRMDAFGQMTITTESITNNLRFPGQYYDQESGLHYNYFRNYDPGIGRYTSSDPIGIVGGFSVYNYALNNTLLYTDSYGLLFCFTDSEIEMIAAVTGGAVTGGIEGFARGGGPMGALTGAVIGGGIAAVSSFAMHQLNLPHKEVAASGGFIHDKLSFNPDKILPENLFTKDNLKNGLKGGVAGALAAVATDNLADFFGLNLGKFGNAVSAGVGGLVGEWVVKGGKLIGGVAGFAGGLAETATHDFLEYMRAENCPSANSAMLQDALSDYCK